MRTTERIVNAAIKGLVRIACRIDAAELDAIPREGPLIIATNHITFLEAPIYYTHLMPRPLTAFSKTETWENPFLGWLFDLWEIIPLKRGEADLGALRKGMEVLKQGTILTIAPEGTRSGNGQLARGYPGIVTVALRSGSPIIPTVSYGHEHLKANLRRLRRTDFHIRVGNPFHLKETNGKLKREIRTQMTDEIMYQLAALLPTSYRGIYSDLSRATEEYLQFENPSLSNLLRAQEPR